MLPIPITTIYPLPLDSGGIQICAVSNLLIPEFFLEGRGVYMKRDQRETVTFTRYVDIFKFLKLIFDRICIPPPKKDRGI